MANKTYYTRAEIVEVMKQRQGVRSQNDFAIELEITQGHLANIYNGLRNPNDDVLAKLGFEKAEALYQRRK